MTSQFHFLSEPQKIEDVILRFRVSLWNRLQDLNSCPDELDMYYSTLKLRKINYKRKLGV